MPINLHIKILCSKFSTRSHLRVAMGEQNCTQVRWSTSSESPRFEPRYFYDELRSIRKKIREEKMRVRVFCALNNIWNALTPINNYSYEYSLHNLRFIYTTTKTQRFCVSIGHFFSNEIFFRFIKPASLTRKRRVFVVV